jgi:plastocyanin
MPRISTFAAGATAALTVALGGLPAAAATRSRTASARDHRVALKNISITPSTLRVKRGDSVTWIWGDKSLDTMHNVTSYGRSRFRSADTRLTGTYRLRFTRPGTYLYRCTIHPLAMTGKIVVR